MLALTALATICMLSAYIPVGLQAVSELPVEAPAVAEQLVEEVTEGVEAPPIVEAERPATIIPPAPQVVEDPVLVEDTDAASGLEGVDDTSPNTVVPLPELSEAAIEAQKARVLEKASAALISVKTAKGEFEQYNPDGSFMTGTFALRRPGRMRFDYDDPVPVIVVADGTNVTQADTELPEYNTVPLGATPLRFLLDDQISFDDDDMEVVNVSEDLGLVTITVEDATGELDGRLTLLFKESTYDLIGWIATDSELQTRQVSLRNVESNVPLDARLFRLDNPRDEEDER